MEQPCGISTIPTNGSSALEESSNLSVGDTPLPESVDYSLILPISGGPDSFTGRTYRTRLSLARAYPRLPSVQ
ncbi:hypothetical protein OUZ56_024153 [Daphnia magna]|uniref:Uncharacterized protein n=1 Tax=Daphnia magna TaxID=35525 RepID=A0ABR0B0L0_9CRUS|nr:hypothetical protein OUZ56_024153 [Daphnia magna]